MKKLSFIQLLLSGLSLIFMYSCKQSFPEVGATEFTLDKTEVVVMVGDKESVKANIFPDNASHKKVTWTSADPDIATVNVKGEVTGLKEGETTVTAYLDGGTMTSSCKIYVTTKIYNVISIKLDVERFLLNMGDTRTLVTTVLPENAANKNVTWTSSDEGIAKVDQNGAITPVSEGETVITVTTEDGGKTATCAVTVTQPGKVTGITLDTEALSLLPGESHTLVATILPADAINKDVIWQSDNPGIASVDGTGKVTGVASGIATITATTVDQGKTASATIRVGAVFTDDFDRANTSWADKNTTPNPIGSDWAITDGYFQLLDQKVKASRVPSGVTPAGTLQASMFYRAPGAITKNVGGSFVLSADMVVEAPSGWVGFILNAQDDNHFYAFRIRGEVGRGAIQFLATADGGANWTTVMSKGTHEDLSAGVYKVTISSETAGRFAIKITKNAAVYYEATVVDSEARYSNGHAGLFMTGGSNIYMLYDDFSLQVR